MNAASMTSYQSDSYYECREGDNVLIVSYVSKEIEVNGTKVNFSDQSRQYPALTFLVKNEGYVITREMFLSHLYRNKDKPGHQIIDVFICHLRKKLGPFSHYIKTSEGRGYRWQQVKCSSVRKRNGFVERLNRKTLTFDTRSSARNKRWSCRRKAEIIAAIRSKLLSREEAMRLYGLSEGELTLWEWCINLNGEQGLQAGRIQEEYRRTVAGPRS